MLSAISVGVTTPCFVSVCRMSSMDSSLFRVLFWHSSQMNSRLTAWKKDACTFTRNWFVCILGSPLLLIALIISFKNDPVFSHPAHRALCKSSGGLLDIAHSCQIQSSQSSCDVAADSDSMIALILGYAWRPTGLLVLEESKCRYNYSSCVISCCVTWQMIALIAVLWLGLSYLI